MGRTMDNSDQNNVVCKKYCLFVQCHAYLTYACHNVSFYFNLSKRGIKRLDFIASLIHRSTSGSDSVRHTGQPTSDCHSRPSA